MNFFAGASLPQHVFDALGELALQTVGERILTMSGLGATETAPSAMFCTRETSYSGGVGLPAPCSSIARPWWRRIMARRTTRASFIRV